MFAGGARLKSIVGSSRTWFASAVALFAVARVVPFARARVGLVLDSFDYLGLAKHKSLLATLGAHRPPTYLFFLRLLGSNRQLVTWAQFTIAVVAWVLLAAMTSRSLQTRIGRILGVAVVLLLGSCLDVVQWDRLIGTESLSLSLGVMVVAAALWLRERVNPRRAAAFCSVAFLWGMLRDANAIVIGGAGVGVGMAAWMIAKSPSTRRCLLAIAIVGVATLGSSLVSADAGARWQQPVQNVVTFRVLSSPERASYFLRSGLPLTPARAHDLAGHCANTAGAFLCEKVTDPAFYRWIDHHARNAYLRSWLAFPATTIWEPLAHTREMIGVRLPLEQGTGTRFRPPYGRYIETVVFPRSPRVLIAWLLGLLVALGITIRRKRWVTAATIPLALILLTYLHLWAVWTGDAVELARHGLAASLQLRLGLWFLSVVLIDTYLVE